MNLLNREIKVAAIQMDCNLVEINENLVKSEKLIEKAVSKGAQLIVLPEFFNTGYRVEEKDETVGEEIPGDLTEQLTAISKKHNVIIVAAIIEKSKLDGVHYDTAFIVSSKGLEAKYRKNYLWDQENIRFRKGQEYVVSKIGEATIGLQICYEIGFPEGARILTLSGANILIYPSAFGKARLHVWDIASRARAIENGCFVIAANRIGTEKEETHFGGHSRIISPDGEILASLQDEEGVIVATINLDEVTQQRKKVPYLKDLNIPNTIEHLKKFNNL
ncbi:carbon-nitrogen hydrolase family protein [Lysinibacillus sp. NPDC056232]|uniref:carbon-nitrogen hydrolase family protein n=1 Tax=Lysinibacillus sp. NPDC056232 TaxID=3345756 RepID=UPI0035D8D326